MDAAGPTRERSLWSLALLGVVGAALALRLWGIRHGLPFVYNPDELSHFVPKAVTFHAEGHFDPGYYVNPPAFSYLLYVVFAVVFGGSDGVVDAFAERPEDVFLAARVTAALVSAAAVAVLYCAGRRFFDRGVGLLAAAVLAVAFLPVHWSHQAVNDTPALLAVAAALLGSAGIFRLGRRRDYLLGGAAVGLAAATKYTAGILVLVVLGAALLHLRRGRRPALLGLGLAGAAAVVAFIAGNPYALLAPGDFWSGLTQLSVTPQGEVKLGQEGSGIVYYLWALTWGLGWIPLVAAAAGAVLLIVRRDPLALVLLPAPAVFVLFMGLQERYFGRWLMPILPVLALLAGYAAAAAVRWVASARPCAAPLAAVLAAASLLVQGLFFSVHGDLVLAREETRNATREWLLANVPARTRVVVEPTVPGDWFRDPAGDGPRWQRVSVRAALGRLVDEGRVDPADLPEGRVPAHVPAARYVRYLRPEVLDFFEARGVCWVVAGSFEWGRALSDPDLVPGAIAYYRELEQRADVAFAATPYRDGAGPVEFNFDLSNNYYPLAYERPGPEMKVYRLRGGACSTA